MFKVNADGSVSKGDITFRRVNGSSVWTTTHGKMYSIIAADIVGSGTVSLSGPTGFIGYYPSIEACIDAIATPAKTTGREIAREKDARVIDASDIINWDVACSIRIRDMRELCLVLNRAPKRCKVVAASMTPGSQEPIQGANWYPDWDLGRGVLELLFG